MGIKVALEHRTTYTFDRRVTLGGVVPPVKGVIFTEARTSTMSVTVDVAPS